MQTMRNWTKATPPGVLFGMSLGVLAVLMIAISPLALVSLGLNYEETGGSPLEKLHPATPLAALLILVAAVMSGNPVTWALRQATESPSLLPYLGIIALLILHSVRVVGLPFTHFFDTFILPLFVYLLFKDPGEQRGRHFAWLIHLVMAANAVIGIGEFATGLRLTPIVAAGVVIEDDWRSSALLGHPLANAALTGSYVLMLALGGGRDLPQWLRSLAFGLAAAAMIVFGGRAATVFLVATLIAIAGLDLASILRGRRFSTMSVVKALVLAPVAGLVVVVLAEQGYFDRFIERFIDDKGSAETRTDMFELLRHVPLSELLLAPDAKQVTTWQHIYGLEFGIESFWLSYILTYGLIPSLVFFAALAFFTRDVLARLVARSGWAFLFFYAVASTSVSLSAKSPLLAVFTLMALVLMRQLPPAGYGAPRLSDRPSRRPYEPAFR